MTGASGVAQSARALWFVAPRTIELRETPVRAPEADEVLVRTRASLISAGTEMVVYRGQTTPQDRLPPTSEGTFPFPLKYGYQCVGVVVQAGSDAGYPEGARVFARHPHQELFTIKALPTLLTRLPDELDDPSATFINLTRVALTGLLDVPVRTGEVAVVFGQGVVGMMCARLARRTASAVVAIDPFPQRRELALQYGADAAVAPEDAAAAVQHFSRGRGADVVYEASGAGAALQSAIEVAAKDGEIVALSLYGSRPVPLRLAPEFHFRRLKVTSSQGGDQLRWDWARRTEATIDLLTELDVHDMIAATVPFDRAADAYDRVDRRPEDSLGVVLTYR